MARRKLPWRQWCVVWHNLDVHLVSYNIHYSKGKDGRYDLARIAGEIDGADVVTLQEVVRNGPGLPDADQPARVAELLEGHHWVFGPTVDLDGGRPGVRLQFGNMVLSRWPILASRLLLFPRVRTFDQTSVERGALETVIGHPAGPIRVYSVHLDHVNSRHRQAEVGALLEAVLSAARSGTTLTGPAWKLFDPPITSVPVAGEAVVAGDFNMLPGSIEYEAMVGEVDYYTGRVITDDRLVDSWTHAGNDIEDGVTWPEADMSVKLDYAFVTAGLAQAVVSTRIDNDTVGSDHDPLWLELDL